MQNRAGRSWRQNACSNYNKADSSKQKGSGSTKWGKCQKHEKYNIERWEGQAAHQEQMNTHTNHQDKSKNTQITQETNGAPANQLDIFSLRGSGEAHLQDPKLWAKHRSKWWNHWTSFGTRFCHSIKFWPAEWTQLSIKMFHALLKTLNHQQNNTDP